MKGTKKKASHSQCRLLPFCLSIQAFNGNMHQIKKYVSLCPSWRKLNPNVLSIPAIEQTNKHPKSHVQFRCLLSQLILVPPALQAWHISGLSCC